jgi:hypothetical protein
MVANSRAQGGVAFLSFIVSDRMPNCHQHCNSYLGQVKIATGFQGGAGPRGIRDSGHGTRGRIADCRWTIGKGLGIGGSEFGIREAAGGCSVGVPPAVPGASHSRQCAGRMPTQQRAGRPRYARSGFSPDMVRYCRREELADAQRSIADGTPTLLNLALWFSFAPCPPS